MYDFYNIEAPYVSNAYHGTGDKWNKIYIATGDTPVVLSAPHAVVTSRKGEGYHKAECYTGALTEILQKETNCSCLTNRCYTKEDDPNTQSDKADYKKFLASLIKSTNTKLFIDIHGMSADVPCDIEIAVDDFKNCNAEIVEDLFNRLAAEYFIVKIDSTFFAKNPTVLTKWVKEKYGVNSIEIEISKSLRDLRDEFAKDRLQTLTNVLKDFILSYK